ncbi:hypothetical protein LSCM4_00656 [Leishmania orientalis]|uniref:Uncharacterized protein n=1 Tax=Leishmania orientalis TaxID=2249476 RepID=A0A836KGY7_9TRYP|nr:hypothetical protein LSCM4_00656 [Leishmania orientalis]
MLLLSAPLRRLTGATFVFNSCSLLRRGRVATPQFSVHVGAFGMRATAIPPFGASLASCVRQRSTVARSTWWRASRSVRSWRQKRTAPSSEPLRSKKASKSRVTSTRRRQPKVIEGKTLKSVRGKRQPQKRLSAHQRQAKKYNKRVEAIARLWKEQQQSASKSSEKSLAPRRK